MPLTIPTDVEKQAVWDAYHAHQPTRVPMTLIGNARLYLLDPRWNVQGYTFEQAAEDPYTHLMVDLNFQLYVRTHLNRFCDNQTALPEVWESGTRVYNVYDAACLGAQVHYDPGQVPDTVPAIPDDDRERIFQVDITRPLELPFIRKYLAFTEELKRIAKDLRFEGRPVKISPFAPIGTDGPLTVACNLRGGGFLLELLDEDDYAQRLLRFVSEAVVHRRRAFRELYGADFPLPAWLADDCCQMIGVDTYREMILPWHRRLFDTGATEGVRAMHMCGRATHLFPTIRDELKVEAFDTGFPVDHGQLRRGLGPDVAIQGGTEIDLLLHGSADQVYRRTRDIMQSGVMRGGRFMLREGNNLPPCCPDANLQAMYEACLEFGRYKE